MARGGRLLVVGLLLAQASAVTIVQDGQPAAAIVTAAQPTRAAADGAALFQKLVRQSTGAELPIANDAAPPDGALVLIGESALTRQMGIDPDSFQLEELRGYADADRLVLIGDDARPDGEPLMGSYWAVCQFCDHLLGVKMLWPGPLGTVVPKRATIAIPNLQVGMVPPLRQRKIRNLGYNDRVQRGLDAYGWSADEYQQRIAEANEWFRFQRLGGSFRGGYGHAYGDLWSRFGETHPEWFALQADGSRDQSRADQGHRARLCVSNPGLIAQIAADKVAELKAKPLEDCVSISPNDGSGATTFCCCPACEAWDDPHGEPLELRLPSGETVQHVSFTDRFVKFYAAIAEQVAKELPDRYLGAYAYSTYKLPPISATLPPNVMIGLVDFGYLNEADRRRARASWEAWSKAADKLFLRPNILMAGLGFPTVYAHRLAEDIRFCADRGMLVTDFDGCLHNWAIDGLNYYVLANLLWDPQTDIDRVIDEYCQAGFGPAANQVRVFFDRIEAVTTAFAATEAYEGRKANPEVLAGVYTDGLLQELSELLDQAERAAADHDDVLARIDFLRQPLAFAKLKRDYVLARAAGDRQAADRVAAERDAWVKAHGQTFALNAAYLRFYGF